MDINNWYAVFGFIFLAVGVVLEAILLVRLIKELHRRPRDEFRSLTIGLLRGPIIYITTLAPFIPQLALITQRPPVTMYGAFITVYLPLGMMVFAMNSYYNYTYKEHAS